MGETYRRIGRPIGHPQLGCGRDRVHYISRIFGVCDADVALG